MLRVSGHDHSLQYIERAGVRQLVAGSTVRSDHVYPSQDARYVSSNCGVAALNEDEGGAVWLDLDTFDCREAWPCGADGDGAPDGTFGGTDCDDADASVFPGTTGCAALSCEQLHQQVPAHLRLPRGRGRRGG